MAMSTTVEPRALPKPDDFGHYYLEKHKEVQHSHVIWRSTVSADGKKTSNTSYILQVGVQGFVFEKGTGKLERFRTPQLALRAYEKRML